MTIDIINKPTLRGFTAYLEGAQRKMLLSKPHTKIKVQHIRKAFYVIDADPNDITYGMKYGRGDGDEYDEREEWEDGFDSEGNWA